MHRGGGLKMWGFRTTDWANWSLRAARVPTALDVFNWQDNAEACPDTIYAVAGHYFQQNFLAFWRSVDGGLNGRRKPPETRPNLLGYTVSGRWCWPSVLGLVHCR